MNPSRITPPIVAMVAALALTLTGCAASPAASSPTEAPAVETTPPADAAPMFDADAPHLCGQVSALEGIRDRSGWEHEQGLIDDAAYASRVAALEDGWRLMIVSTRVEVSPAIEYAQRAIAEGGLSYENEELAIALGKVAEACNAAGSLITVSALPGQGG
ncbi:hypothetical protein [Agromyces sp. Marseille-Q5079]|uniref:hypothetical protein n=1 Tax=Agromyces sp. Marseille-Q5079 TaxID=3439059 RepID=UPI003D9CA215